MHVSRKYLKEKWEPLEWDMRILLAGETDGEVPEEVVMRVRDNIRAKAYAIVKELFQGE